MVTEQIVRDAFYKASEDRKGRKGLFREMAISASFPRSTRLGASQAKETLRPVFLLKK